MELTFTLDSRAMKTREKTFAAAQSYIDSECIRLMTPFVPVGLPRFRNSGRLRDSAENPEPGCIEYTAPLAEHDYYANVSHANGGNPNATRLWFETMKQTHAEEIFKGVCRIIGG